MLDRLDRLGIRTRTLIYKTAQGSDILRQPRGIWAGHDAPQFSIHRGRLQRLLFDAVVERLGDRAVQTGHALRDVQQTGSGVTARFDTGGGPREVAADVLIGADGIHSAIRRHWSPHQGNPSWQGVVMWRGAHWTQPFLDGQTMIIAGGMAAKLVLYPIATHPDRPDEVLTNWVVCAKVSDGSGALPHPDDWSRRGDLDEVLSHVHGRIAIPEIDIADLIRASPGSWVYPMCDRDPLDTWTRGRVTLLGDAAHPMYPVGSNGASQAVLDAVSLAVHLAADGIAGLAAYDAERRPATAAIVHANRQGGPERVIDLIESRAPQGFRRLEDVATEAELHAIVGDYQTMADFSVARPSSA